MPAEQNDYERMTVRLPTQVHTALRDSAKANRRSINGELIVILEERLAETEAAGEPVKTAPTA